MRRNRQLFELISLLAVAGCTAQVGAASQTQAPAPPRDYVFVTNQGEASVSMIDRDRHVEVRRIDLTKLGFSPNAKPHHVVVESDGSYWYVSLIGDNRVLKLDREGRLVGQAPMGRSRGCSRCTRAAICSSSAGP